VASASTRSERRTSCNVAQTTSPDPLGSSGEGTAVEAWIHVWVLGRGYARSLPQCPQGEQAIAAGENQANSQLKDSYDYIIVGAGASGSVIAGEISKTGADVLVVESAPQTRPTIGNPSIWFYNVGSPLDWSLPIEPTPQLNNRKFKWRWARGWRR